MGEVDPAIRVVEHNPGWAAAARAELLRLAAALGYRSVPDPEMPDYHFFGKPAERPRTHHLHVCEAGGEHERRHLAVRDFLRAHADEAARYAQLKRAVAERHPRDRPAYMAGKDRHVRELEARALRWAGG